MVLCFFKQNTAYEMRISDWSSDVCSSDLPPGPAGLAHVREFLQSVGGAGARHRAGDWLAESADRDTSGRSECGASARSRRDRETTIAVKIGSASCRDRVCQYVLISVFAVSLKKH